MKAKIQEGVEVTMEVNFLAGFDKELSSHIGQIAVVTRVNKERGRVIIKFDDGVERSVDIDSVRAV